MTVIFVWLGSAADYGSFGRWLLLALTVVCWAFQYGMMAIRNPNQWPAAMGLYVISYIAYGATLVFYAAVFPRLARYMPHVRKAREDLRDGTIDQEEYDTIESLEKNHIRYTIYSKSPWAASCWPFPVITAPPIRTSDIFARLSSTWAFCSHFRTIAIRTIWHFVWRIHVRVNPNFLPKCGPFWRYKRLACAWHMVVYFPAITTRP